MCCMLCSVLHDAADNLSSRARLFHFVASYFMGSRIDYLSFRVTINNGEVSNWKSSVFERHSSALT